MAGNAEIGSRDAEEQGARIRKRREGREEKILERADRAGIAKEKEKMWRIRLFVKERVERFWIWIAWKLPRELTRWSALRLMAFAWANPGDETPDEISIMDALERWE